MQIPKGKVSFFVYLDFQEKHFLFSFLSRFNSCKKKSKLSLSYKNAFLFLLCDFNKNTSSKWGCYFTRHYKRKENKICLNKRFYYFLK